MTDTYTVASVNKTISNTGAVAQTAVVLTNTTNIFGPAQLQVNIAGDFTVKPGDSHTLSLT